MGSALGDVTLGVVAGFLQLLGGGTDLVRTFLAATADEDTLHGLVVEARGRNLIRVVGAAGEALS